MPHLALRECGRLAAAFVGVTSLPRIQRRRAAARQATANDTWGTVILPFGRYFASHADMLTWDGFKTIVPIDNISPFSGVGEPDPEMQHFADSERANDRVKTDVRKDLAARLAEADAQFLVVDNSTALLYHREVNGRLYTVLPGEDTDLMDMLSKTDAAEASTLAFKISHDGLTESLRSTYDSFVRACLDSFDPANIILVRSHAARFWISDDGTIAPTNIDRRDARLLEALDYYFITQTGCRVADGTLGHFPSAVSWQSFDHRLRRVIEEDLVELCTSHLANDAPDRPDADPARHLSRKTSAADHVVGAFRRGRPVDENWLQAYFAAGGASYDDLLALAYLEQCERRRWRISSFVRAVRGRRSELPPAGGDEEAFRPFPPCSPRLAVGSTGWAARRAVGLVPAEYPWLALGLAAWCPPSADDFPGPAGAGSTLSGAGGAHSGFFRAGCGPRRSRFPAGASSSAFLAMARSGGSRCPGWRCRRPTRSSTAGCPSRRSTCSTSSGRGRCISSGGAGGSPPLPRWWSPTSTSWSTPAPGSTGRRCSTTSGS